MNELSKSDRVINDCMVSKSACIQGSLTAAMLHKLKAAICISPNIVVSVTSHCSSYTSFSCSFLFRPHLAWLAAKLAEYVDKDSNGVQQGHGALVHARHEPYWKHIHSVTVLT